MKRIIPAFDQASACKEIGLQIQPWQGFSDMEVSSVSTYADITPSSQRPFSESPPSPLSFSAPIG